MGRSTDRTGHARSPLDGTYPPLPGPRDPVVTLATYAGVLLTLLGAGIAGAHASGIAPRRPALTRQASEVPRAAPPPAPEPGPGPIAPPTPGREPLPGARELADAVGSRALVAAHPFVTPARTTLDGAWRERGEVELRCRAHGTDRRTGRPVVLTLRWSFDRAGTRSLEVASDDAALPPVAATAVTNLVRASLHPLAVRTLLDRRIR